MVVVRARPPVVATRSRRGASPRAARAAARRATPRSSVAARPARVGSNRHASQPEEGPLRRRPPDEEGGRREHQGQPQRHQDLVAPLDDRPGHDRPHDRRARRPQARPRLRDRLDGRPQARGVRPDPHLPRARQGRPEGTATLMPTTERRRHSARRETLLGDRPGAFASARYVRITPMKARRVVNMVRGLPVDDALNLLAFAPQTAATTVHKVLESAVANAETTEDLTRGELVVTVALVDEGPTMKRWRPRAQGRATRINKRTSHITLAVEPVAKPVVQSKGPVKSTVK